MKNFFKRVPLSKNDKLGKVEKINKSFSAFHSLIENAPESDKSSFTTAEPELDRREILQETNEENAELDDELQVTEEPPNKRRKEEGTFLVS